MSGWGGVVWRHCWCENPKSGTASPSLIIPFKNLSSLKIKSLSMHLNLHINTFLLTLNLSLLSQLENNIGNLLSVIPGLFHEGCSINTLL